MIRYPHDELQQHKERITDKVQGIVTTIDKIPSILHADTKQVTAVSKGLLSREAGIYRTKETLDVLPAELSSYDQEVDELNLRALDIQRSLHILSGALTPASNAADSSSSGQPAGSTKKP